MNSVSAATLYIDYLARLLVIIDSFPLKAKQLFALHDFLNIANVAKKEFEALWKLDEKNFFMSLDAKISQLESSQTQDRYVTAYVLCIEMDACITFIDVCDKNKVSLYPIIPVKKNNPIIRTTPLNNNCSNTKIEIHPKFEVYQIDESIYGEQKTRAMSNKDAFSGINGYLTHISYTKSTDDYSVIDIVLDPPDSFDGKEISIGFSPLTNQDVVDFSEGIMQVQGISLKTNAVKGIKSTKRDNLKKRFESAWNAACKKQVDIVFFPELLGLDEFETNQYSFNSYIKALSEQAIEKGLNPPKVTFLPSYCSEEANRISVVYQNGKLIGCQNKLYPYVDTNGYKMEAVRTTDCIQIVVLHLPGVHRIATLICSDYLTCSLEMQAKLFADLGITLLLVPSYSKGEQDFINKLTDLKKYGTSVVWGNCCGATKPKRIIGGCCVAALDSINRFDEVAKCDNECKQGCIFITRIPLRIKRILRERVEIENLIVQEKL